MDTTIFHPLEPSSENIALFFLFAVNSGIIHNLVVVNFDVDRELGAFFGIFAGSLAALFTLVGGWFWATGTLPSLAAQFVLIYGLSLTQLAPALLRKLRPFSGGFAQEKGA